MKFIRSEAVIVEQLHWKNSVLAPDNSEWEGRTARRREREKESEWGKVGVRERDKWLKCDFRADMSSVYITKQSLHCTRPFHLVGQGNTHQLSIHCSLSKVQIRAFIHFLHWSSENLNDHATRIGLTHFNRSENEKGISPILQSFPHLFFFRWRSKCTHYNIRYSSLTHRSILTLWPWVTAKSENYFSENIFMISFDII